MRGLQPCRQRASRSGLLLLLASPLFAQPAPVRVHLAPNEPTVGDHVQATISLRVQIADLADEPRFPDWQTSWGEAEVVETGPAVKVSEQDGTAVYEQRLVLAAFRPGEVALPPQQIVLPLKGGTVRTSTPAALALAVRSVIPRDAKEPQPKPPAAPRPLPVGERFWWTLAILSAVCLTALWPLVRRRSGASTAATGAPTLAPFEELTAEMDRLRSETSMVALHTRLSLALRRYVGRRLPFPALESTTSEIQRRLLSRRLPGPLVRQAVELLRACDLVKFARQDVGEPRARERAEEALRIAGELESHLAPREPESLEAAG